MWLECVLWTCLIATSNMFTNYVQFSIKSFLHIYPVKQVLKSLPHYNKYNNTTDALSCLRELERRISSMLEKTYKVRLIHCTFIYLLRQMWSAAEWPALLCGNVCVPVLAVGRLRYCYGRNSIDDRWLADHSSPLMMDVKLEYCPITLIADYRLNISAFVYMLLLFIVNY